MSEGPAGDFAKLGERFLEGVPGFALVATVLGGVIPFLLPFAAEGPSDTGPLSLTKQALPVIILVLAWVGYFLGHYLDPLLFDPIWGSPGICKASKTIRRIFFFQRLDESRTGLADEWKRPVSGIFAKAQDLMSKTELWDKKVKWPLEWSKAFRSLAILGIVALTFWCRWQWIALIFFFSLVFLFVSTGERWPALPALKTLIFGTTLVCLLIQLLLSTGEHIQLKMFRPLTLAVVTLASAALYLVLRIIHVRTLYESARKLELHECGGVFSAGQKIAPVRNVLLIAGDGVSDDELHKADSFVQSKALMHVKLATGRGTLPSQCYKKRLQLFKHQLERQLKKEPLRFASQSYYSPHISLTDTARFDLVIEYFDRATPEGYDPGFDKRLNGVI